MSIVCRDASGERLQLGLGEGDEAPLLELVALHDLRRREHADARRGRGCRGGGVAGRVVVEVELRLRFGLGRTRRRGAPGARVGRCRRRRARRSRQRGRALRRCRGVGLLVDQRRFAFIGDVLPAHAGAAARQQLEADGRAALGRRIDLHRDRDEPEAEREGSDRANCHDASLGRARGTAHRRAARCRVGEAVRRPGMAIAGQGDAPFPEIPA